MNDSILTYELKDPQGNIILALSCRQQSIDMLFKHFDKEHFISTFAEKIKKSGEFYPSDLLVSGACKYVLLLRNQILSFLTKKDSLMTFSLLRQLSDVVMCTFALTKVEDRDKFAKYLMEGNEIRKYKDSSIKNITYTKLAKYMDKVTPLGNYEKIFKMCCKIIHFGGPHICSVSSVHDNKIITSINDEPFLLSSQQIVECQIACYLLFSMFSYLISTV